MIKFPIRINKSLYKNDLKRPKVFYGLNSQIKFCKRCTYSNQKPTSEKEYNHKASTKKNTLFLDLQGVCYACRVLEKKEKIDWDLRKHKLKKLCDKYRSRNGKYDCLVPGSGGKDSFYAAYKLKYEFNMNPLTVTWSPHIYTDWGWKNFNSWIDAGFTNYLLTPNGKTHRILTRLALEKLFHPFQPFMLGQQHFPPRAALQQFNIPLVFYGDTNAEFGSPDDYNNPSRDAKFFSASKNSDILIAGTPVDELISKFEMTLQDLMPFMPLQSEEFNKQELDVQYLGYYLKWHPQECYYFAVDKGNFEASPERTVGTYSKYNSIDDKLDDFHYYTTFIKFGIGRATYESAQEIRNNDINREEGIALVKKYDGEFPNRFLKEILTYLSLDKEKFPKASKNFEQPIMNLKYFNMLTDKFRSPHIWKLTKNKWQLRKKIWS
jgi:N-acetyl sugar amidotransferase